MADFHFPGKKFVLMMDDLNTHKLSTLNETFVPEGALWTSQRFEVHHTPKHGSWINIAELEINVLSRQCLNRRIRVRGTMVSQVSAWQSCRNSTVKSVNWPFRTEDARVRLKALYPSIHE